MDQQLRCDLDVPIVGPCDENDVSLNKFNSPPPLQPGVYCGGLTIKNSDVEFAPGTYIINNGDLNFQTQSSLVGDGVVFILTGDTPADIGSLDITSNAQLQMTPPDSGDFQGIMFYQDRDALTGPSKTNQIRGSAQLQVDGAFYFPSQTLKISGDAQIQVTSNECAGFIADKLELVGGVQIQMDCNPDSESAIKVSFNRVARLGE